MTNDKMSNDKMSNNKTTQTDLKYVKKSFDIP